MMAQASVAIHALSADAEVLSSACLVKGQKYTILAADRQTRLHDAVFQSSRSKGGDQGHRAVFRLPGSKACFVQIEGHAMAIRILSPLWGLSNAVEPVRVFGPGSLSGSACEIQVIITP
eukprot:jgi/Ulvmu1/8294/UM041_0106.1